MRLKNATSPTPQHFINLYLGIEINFFPRTTPCFRDAWMTPYCIFPFWFEYLNLTKYVQNMYNFALRCTYTRKTCRIFLLRFRERNSEEFSSELDSIFSWVHVYIFIEWLQCLGKYCWYTYTWRLMDYCFVGKLRGGGIFKDCIALSE